jgi:hypothetical protein
MLGKCQAVIWKIYDINTWNKIPYILAGNFKWKEKAIVTFIKSMSLGSEKNLW